MGRVDVSQYQSFADITGRLDAIVGQVRDKDVSLERSLDLFDEAIALGSKAVSMVDATDFSPEEEARMKDPVTKPADGASDGAAGDKDASADGADAAAKAGDGSASAE